MSGPAARGRRGGLRRSDDGRRPPIRAARRGAGRPRGARRADLGCGGLRAAPSGAHARVRGEVAHEPRAPFAGRLATRHRIRRRSRRSLACTSAHAHRRGGRCASCPQGTVTLSFVALLAVLVMMLAEAWLSASNERWLRQQGAVEPSRDVYSTMRWAYPAAFVAMAIEGAAWGS